MSAKELWDALSPETVMFAELAETLQSLREAVAGGQVASRQCDLELLDQLIAMRGPLCDPDALGKPVTVLQVAEHRLGRPARNGEDFQAADIQMLGGCTCGASVAAYNACPSKLGVWLCSSGCIDGSGFDDVRVACRACGGCAACGGTIDALTCPRCQSSGIVTIGEPWNCYDDDGNVVKLRKMGCECGVEFWFETPTN